MQTNVINSNKKQRSVNFELLRIISMVMILVLHISCHGKVGKVADPASFSFQVSWFFTSLAYVAVNCYVLISGYFLVTSKFSIKRILTMWFQVLFFSVGIYLIMVQIGQVKYDFIDFINTFAPVASYQYWFFTCYIGMCFLAPFLNIAINAMSKKQHLIAIIAGFLLFSVYSNLEFTLKPFSMYTGHNILWFCYMYLIGSYLRLYPLKINKYSCLICYFVLSVFVYISKSLLSLTNLGYFSNFISSDYFVDNTSILVVPASVCLFLFFAQIDIKNELASRIILFLSPLAFGVYLIHDNPYFRQYFWGTIVNATKFIDNALTLLIYSIFVIAVTYIVCSLIEFLRQQLFTLIKMPKFIDFVSNKLNLLGNKFMNSKAVKKILN